MIRRRTAVTASQTIKDRSGHGNDLSVLNTGPGSAADALTWSSDFHPNQPQLVFYPTNQPSSTTLWGQGLPEDTWWHLAVVNDGKHTTLYVEGCPTVDTG